MKITHEVKPQNGIPTLSKSDIERLVNFNPMRELKFQITSENVVSALENLKLIYAEHTGHQPVESNDHAPCLGLDGKCGSVLFNRTGTCFVCVNCGTPQGCS